MSISFHRDMPPSESQITSDVESGNEGTEAKAWCILTGSTGPATAMALKASPIVIISVARLPAPTLFGVLLIAHLFQPFDVPAVDRLLNGDMRHGVRRGGAMPMLHARRRPYDVARLDLLLLASLLLHPAGAGRHDQGLAERMGVPCRARARLEGDAGSGNAGERFRLEQRIDAHRAGEVLLRCLVGALRAVPRDGHGLVRRRGQRCAPAKAG